MLKKVETAIMIPPPPPVIAEAAGKLREAVEKRKVAQSAHSTAMLAYQAQKPGEPQTVKAVQVDELADAIQPAIDAERAADAALQQAKADYRDAVNTALRAPLSEFERDLADAYGRLESLLAKGIAITADARSAGISLPAAAPGVCKQVQAAIMPMLRNILRQGRVNV